MTDSIHIRFREVLTQVGPYKKDSTAKVGEKFSYDYADINSILAMLKPVLHEHRLCVYQPVSTRDQMTYVDTVIADLDSDEELVFPGMAFSTSKDPQAAGSAITYFRRYCIVSLFALQAGDDDAQQVRDQLEKESQPHPLSARVNKAGQRVRKLSAGNKEELESRHGGKIKPSDLLADEVALARIEEWLDELEAPSG